MLLDISIFKLWLWPTLEARIFSELIDDRVIFQKSVFRFFYGYSLFLAISFRVIDVWSSELLTIGLLYLCLVLSEYSLSSTFWLIRGVILSMEYSGNSIARLCSRVCIIWHRSKIYTAGSVEDVYILIIVQSA